MLPMYGGANQGNPQGRDMFQDLKDWWNGTGLFTKSLAYSTLAFQILTSIGIVPFFRMFANNTGLTILSFQLWRPFTAGLVHIGIIELLIIYLMVLPVSAVQEKQWGTLKTGIDFFIKNFEIHMSCNIIFLILGFVVSDFWTFPTYGLWCFFMFNLSQQCLLNPDGVSRFCCLPFQIPNKWYPLVLILVFSLMGRIRFDMLMAYFIAYAHCHYLDEKYHSFLNASRMTRWADLSVFSWMKNNSYYVGSTGEADPNLGFSGQAAGQSIGGANRGPQQSQQPEQTVTPPAKSFGGRGVAIGGTDANDRDPEDGGILDRINKPKAYNKLGEEDDESGHFDLDSQTTDAQSQNI